MIGQESVVTFVNAMNPPETAANYRGEPTVQTAVNPDRGNKNQEPFHVPIATGTRALPAVSNSEQSWFQKRSPGLPRRLDEWISANRSRGSSKLLLEKRFARLGKVRILNC